MDTKGAAQAAAGMLGGARGEAKHTHALFFLCGRKPKGEVLAPSVPLLALVWSIVHLPGSSAASRRVKTEAQETNENGRPRG